MKLQLFNGGLNTRLAPELIQSSESVVCHNADLSSGQLQSSKAPSTTVVTPEVEPYFFKSEALWMPLAILRDYLDYQGRLYFTDGVLPKKQILGVELITNGRFLANLVGWANSSLAGGSLVWDASKAMDLVNTSSPAIADQSFTTEVGQTYTLVLGGPNIPSLDISVGSVLGGTDLLTASTTLSKQHTFTATSAISYLRLANAVLATTQTINKVYCKSSTIQDLGIDAPVAINAILGGAGLVNGTVQYAYTYYNIADGTESAQSPLSTEVLATNQVLTIHLAASLDPQVTHIFLYRIGGTLLSFTKIIELPNTSVLHIDNIADSTVVGNTLSSDFNGKPPSGLRYLTESNGTFFGAVGSKLHFSRDTGNPNYWPAINQINFHETITGVAESSIGLVVFTFVRAYVLSGTGSASYTKYPLSGTQGCINHKTIVDFDNALMFLSTDGICALNGSIITVVSRPKLGKQNYQAVNAVVFDSVYYCQLSDHSLITFDLRYEPSFKTFNFDSTFLVVAEDTLYAQAPLGVVELFAGALVEYTYQTGNLTEGVATNLKTYDEVFIAMRGTLTLTIRIDKKVVQTKTFTETAKPQVVAVPQDLQRGASISFEVVGIGTLAELEYKVVGRDNGN